MPPNFGNGIPGMGVLGSHVGTSPVSSVEVSAPRLGGATPGTPAPPVSTPGRTRPSGSRLDASETSDPIQWSGDTPPKPEHPELPSVLIDDLVIDFALNEAVRKFGGIDKTAPFLAEGSKYLGEDMGVFIFQGEKRWSSLLKKWGYTFSNANTNAGNGQNWNAGFFAGDIGGYQQGAWALAIAVDPNTSLAYMNQLADHYLNISESIHAPVYVDWGGTRIKYYQGEISIWDPPLNLDE